jgi:S1-C subfamily serine protease
VPEDAFLNDTIIRSGANIQLPVKYQTRNCDLTGKVKNATSPFRFFELSKLGLGTAASKDGVVVESVEAKSAFAAAGLSKGDVIVTIDGIKVDTTAALRKLVRSAYVRGEGKLTIRRGGKSHELHVQFPR